MRIRATEGMKVQGCCCGHQHKLLDDAEALPVVEISMRDGGPVIAGSGARQLNEGRRK